ncbi:MAG TPA: Hsp20/alpha crystallin family protein [bacterium]|nr:Hsp20/alpha crystallin family protein [bacterium]
MSLIPYRNPFWELERWFEEEWPSMKTPKMDIYEKDGKVIAEVELPGVDPKNIEVEVKNNILKVEAKSETSKEEKKKGYYRRELSRGYYQRAVPLPVEVIDEKAEAEYADGILTITIPKAKPEKKEKAKKIKIKVKK